MSQISKCEQIVHILISDNLCDQANAKLCAIASKSTAPAGRASQARGAGNWLINRIFLTYSDAIENPENVSKLKQ